MISVYLRTMKGMASLGVQPKRIVMITMRDMGIGDTVIVTVLNRIEIKST